MVARAKFFILAILTMLLVAACSAQPATPTTAGQPVQETTIAELRPVTLNQGQKLKVVATTSFVADMVKNVGGDKIDLTPLLPLGADPHTFSPTPADLTKVAEAHVIFVNGFGLEIFLDEMLKNAGGQAAAVALSTGLKPRPIAAAEAGHQDEHFTGVDPHTWTTPANATVFVRNIEQALSALDPANTKTYQANMMKYTVELVDLDNWVKAQIDQLPPDKRRLVTDHESLGYYADRYGLELVGAVIPSVSTGSEPSAQQLAALEAAIKKYQVKAIFVDTTVNPALAQRVADDTGLKLVQLYSGSLSDPGGEAGTYLAYIRYNTTAIVNGLK